MSVTDWIRDCARRKGLLEVDEVEHDGARLLRVKVTEGLEVWTVWLDPLRDFMICGLDYLYKSGNVYTKASNNVSEATQISGIWIPTRAIRRSGFSGSRVETEFKYEVEKCQIGTLKQEDTDIVFPTGSKVLDSTRNIAYFILPDGKYRLVSFADRERDTVFVAPRDSVTDRVDNSSANAYSHEPLAVVPARLTAAPTRRSAWLVTMRFALAGGVVMGGIIVLLRWKHQPQKAAK